MTAPGKRDLDTGFELGDWVAHPPTYRLTRDRRAERLEPKLMRLLTMLAERAGSVVSKEEILDEVWGTRHVADSALTRGISELRRILGDDAHDPSYIETIPRGGYRVIAEVRPVEDSPDRPRRSYLLPSLAAAAVVVAIAIALSSAPDPATTGSAVSPSLPDAGAADVRLVQITTRNAFETHPAYHPDGTRLAFASDRDGSLEIYTRSLAPGADDRQVTDDGGVNAEPAWSPDGRFLAYSSLVRGGIWVIPADGGSARRISEFGSAPAWSPDGRSLVFQSDPLRENTIGGYPVLPPSTLWVVAAEGGEPRQITFAGLPPGGHGAPDWSPDGERIVLCAYEHGRGTLWTVRPDGSEPRQIADVRMPGRPSWSTSGNTIFFTAHTFRESWLLEVGVSSRTGETTHAPRRVTRLSALDLAVAPDGRTLAAARATQNSQIWSIDLDENGLPAADPKPLTSGTIHRNSGPSFSPDGSRIAWTGIASGQPPQVWVMSADGSGARQVSLDAERSSSWPQWLPDGRSLAFVTGSRQGPELRRLDLEGLEHSHFFAQPLEWRRARLSPDGGRLAFHAALDEPTPNVHVVDIESGNVSRLTGESDFAGFAVWSNDGQQVALEVGPASARQIAIVSIETPGKARRLTEGRGENWPWSFSPDDSRLAFAAQRDGLWSLRWIPVAGGEEVLLFGEESFAGYVRSPAWSPTGRQIVFERGRLDADIWQVLLGDS